MYCFVPDMPAARGRHERQGVACDAGSSASIRFAEQHARFQ